MCFFFATKLLQNDLQYDLMQLSGSTFFFGISTGFQAQTWGSRGWNVCSMWECWLCCPWNLDYQDPSATWPPGSMLFWRRVLSSTAPGRVLERTWRYLKTIPCVDVNYFHAFQLQSVQTYSNMVLLSGNVPAKGTQLHSHLTFRVPPWKVPASVHFW